MIRKIAPLAALVAALSPSLALADDGVSALMLVAEAGDARATEQLLSMRADADVADAQGHTALMRAAFFGHASVVRALVRAGCTVDAVDDEGNSALHHAGRGSQEFLFDLLEMRYGARSDLLNRNGQAPALAPEPCRIQ